MKKSTVIIIIIVAVSLAGFWFFKNRPAGTSEENNPPINIANMQITSPAFGDQQAIPDKYSCNGQGINPPLEFKNIPASAQTLAFILDDPDAPNGTWTHWTLWNIATSTTQIAENSVPSEAVQGQTSAGQNVYGGPCPPSGTHHYNFKLYALDEKLTIPSYSTADKLVEAMQGHIVEQATLVGLYSKK